MVAYAEEAIQRAGLTVRKESIRGGTDGSRFSYMGMPCPNIFTGMQNIHSKPRMDRYKRQRPKAAENHCTSFDDLGRTKLMNTAIHNPQLLTTSMNRIDRISAILVQLQSKRVVKAQEIADRFRSACVPNVPGYPNTGRSRCTPGGEAGGYSIMEGYPLAAGDVQQGGGYRFLTAGKMVEKPPILLPAGITRKPCSK